PWHPKTFNLTEQGRILKEKGYEEARRLAEAAGATPPPADAPPMPEVTGNPWLPESWNLTHQCLVVKQKGMGRAQELAEAAGSFVGATRPTKRR
ncbi:MAG TPA: hypothetical protein VFF88_07490, partial [Methylocella sp.]|nr:hypothetical protein [Methylocella sp.]